MVKPLINHVNASEGGGQEIRARYPLADAKVSVRSSGAPGSYTLHGLPWLQMEEQPPLCFTKFQRWAKPSSIQIRIFAG